MLISHISDGDDNGQAAGIEQHKSKIFIGGFVSQNLQRRSWRYNSSRIVKHDYLYKHGKTTEI